MSHSFTTLKHLVKRVKHKDPGISFARGNRAWHLILVGVLLGVVSGGIFAGNEFLHIEGINTAVIIDPIETTKYHGKEITEVLVKYDTLAKAFAMNAVATPTTTRAIEKPAESPKPVASTTTMKVE